MAPAATLSEDVAGRGAPACHTVRCVAVDGTTIPLTVESLCVHGDTPGAVAIARAVREALDAASIPVVPFVARSIVGNVP